MKLSICLYGNPVLREKCQPVAEITEEIRHLVQDMIETMDGASGIGIAAPQIGKAIRLFVIRRYIDSSDGTWTVSDPVVYINPKCSKTYGKRSSVKTFTIPTEIAVF